MLLSIERYKKSPLLWFKDLLLISSPPAVVFATERSEKVMKLNSAIIKQQMENKEIKTFLYKRRMNQSIKKKPSFRKDGFSEENFYQWATTDSALAAASP